MLPEWIADYIGREYHVDDWNCWTLCRTLAKKHLGVSDWPAFDFMSPNDRQGVSSLIRAESGQNWVEVMNASLFRQGERGERLGDIAVLRIGMWGSHTALVVGPNKMMHVAEDVPTCVVEMRGHDWKQRVLGVYRWI